MKRLLFLSLLAAGSVLAQVTAPPVSLSNWPTANSALTLADPAATNKVAGWDNSAKKWVWVTAASGGTVTNTGGNLTANSVVLGAGTTDTKVVPGILSDGTSKITLGVAGTSIGTIDFKNATSGTITLTPTTGALGTVTANIPAANSTMAQAKTSSANLWFNSMSAQGVFGTAQPAFGDLTGSIAASQIASGTITYAKIQNVSANQKLLGSSATGSGAAPSEITLGTNLSMSGSTLNATSGGGGTWGSITGTLSAQTDLQSALDGKQAADTDLTTWAGITPASGIGTFLATPSSSNLAAAVTTETGTGSLVFATSPALSNISANQGANGDTNIYGLRATDTGPTGNLIWFQNQAVNADLFKLDVTGAATFSGSITTATGTTTLAPINIPAGTLKTTPAAGDIERDANTAYITTDAGNRGYVPAKAVIYAASTVTYANDTNPHPIFTTPANGRITLETGIYRFHGTMAFTAMSATTGNLMVDMLGAGNATTTNWLWISNGVDGADNSASAGGNSWHGTKVSGANVIIGGTPTAVGFQVDGTFEVTGAGTLIPTMTQVTAAAAVLSAGSYLEIWRMGSTSMTIIGQWD